MPRAASWTLAIYPIHVALSLGPSSFDHSNSWGMLLRAGESLSSRMIRLPGLSDPGRGPSGMPVSTCRTTREHTALDSAAGAQLAGVCPVSTPTVVSDVCDRTGDTIAVPDRSSFNPPSASTAHAPRRAPRPGAHPQPSSSDSPKLGMRRAA